MMQEIFGVPLWVVFGVLFMGYLVYIRQRRRKELAWIERKFGGAEPVIKGFGITFYGRAKDPGLPTKTRGLLLVMPDRLFFRSRAGAEWEAPAASIRDVTHDTKHKGHDVRQSVMVVTYEDESGDEDRVAFQVPYMPQWIKAIQIKLMKVPPKLPL